MASEKKKREPRTGYSRNAGRFSAEPLRLTPKGEETLANRKLDGEIVTISWTCKTTDALKEVTVYAPTTDEAIAIAARHFRTLEQKIRVKRIGHVKWCLLDKGLKTERLCQKYLITDQAYECKLHVDQGVANCECCKGKAGLPHAQRKKTEKSL